MLFFSFNTKTKGNYLISLDLKDLSPYLIVCT